MNDTNQMSLTNWNFSYFNSEFFKALISFTGMPNGNDIEFIYSATVLDTEEKEVFQKDFKGLDEAILFMNSTYGHWTFMDPTLKEGGCSSCEAH